MKLTMDYFTDPLCVWSYISEPTIEKILRDYSSYIDFHFKTIPILDGIGEEQIEGRKIRRPQDMIEEWESAAKSTATEISTNLWKTHPPHSSWPANRALKAALSQDFQKGSRFVHALREAIVLRGENPSDLEVLKQIAADAGLEADKFYDDMTSNAAGLEREVLSDKDEAEQKAVTTTPTLIIQNDRGEKVTIEGKLDMELVRAAAKSLMPEVFSVPETEPSPSI